MLVSFKIGIAILSLSDFMGIVSSDVQALLSLCSDEAVAAKAAVDLCSAQIQKFLCAEQLPLDASSEIIERAFHATEAFVQVATVTGFSFIFTSCPS